MDVHPLIRHDPDPDHPGWWTWEVAAADRFNGVIGKLLVRPGEPGRATCRMFPQEAHSNLGDMVHGGAILTFIDMALFAGGRLYRQPSAWAAQASSSAEKKPSGTERPAARPSIFAPPHPIPDPEKA